MELGKRRFDGVGIRQRHVGRGEIAIRQHEKPSGSARLAASSIFHRRPGCSPQLSGVFSFTHTFSEMRQKTTLPETLFRGTAWFGPLPDCGQSGIPFSGDGQGASVAPRSGQTHLACRSGHIHPGHFRSPAADSSLCHFDDKLPGPARSRPVLKCASDRLTECISDCFRARVGAHTDASCAEGPDCSGETHRCSCAQLLSCPSHHRC